MPQSNGGPASRVLSLNPRHRRLEPGRGRKMGLDRLCTGVLAARLRFTIQVNGRDLGSRGNCGVWESGPFPMTITQFAAPAGRRLTVTLRWEVSGASTNRPIRWSVGLFEMVK